MSRFQNFLERVSDIVYHSTTYKGLAEILATNTFRLTVIDDFEGMKGKPAGKFYYFSTARSRNGSYALRYNKQAMFVLNGQTLNANFKGGAHDYWGPRSRGSAYGAGTPDGNDEMED